MKKYLLVFHIVLFACFALLPDGAQAQQDAQYTQYRFNPLVVNPAYSGSRDALSFTLLYRTQWTAFEGAPKTFSASVHSPVGDRTGLGLHIENDRINVHKRNSIYASYAYRITFANESKLALGLQAGLFAQRSNWSELGELQDNTDEVFATDNSSLQPNFGLGAYYNSKHFYAGFSIPHLINGKLNDVTDNAQYFRHYVVMAGGMFNLNDAVKIRPAILMKTVPSAAPLIADIGLSFIYRDAVWVGTSYRTKDALAFLWQYQMKNGLRFGYSYDITLSKLSSHTHGSHEFMLGWDYDYGKLEKVENPRFF